jgi:hypothetical protein
MSHRPIFRTLGLAGLVALLGLAAHPLRADGDGRFGFEAAVSAPSGNFSDSANNGIEVGGIGRWDLGGGGRDITGRIDLNLYPQKYGISTSSLGVAVDWDFHFTGTHHGPYFLIGGSLLDYSQNVPNDNLNSSTLGLDLGLGVDIDDHLGILARWTTHYVDHTTWTVLNLGFTYTFR